MGDFVRGSCGRLFVERGIAKEEEESGAKAKERDNKHFKSKSEGVRTECA